MDNFNLYKDIQARTGGEIYIGVVGPVRTGKSTFIKRFMDLMVLPRMENEHEKTRARDELPQSSGGKTITTTEPKFIPKEAVEIQVGSDVKARVRLIDCVGYMVEGAVGHIEGDQERMVRTPWFDYEIPFTSAAEIGTKKVINDHSTIGIVVTTDGSFGELPRENYIQPEEKTVSELKKLQKPFIMLLNSSRPYSDETVQLAEELTQRHGVTVMPVNCEQLKMDDINRIMEQVLYEFPISVIEFYMPKWVEMLPEQHQMKQDIAQRARELLQSLSVLKDVVKAPVDMESEYIRRCKIDKIEMDTGCVKMMLDVDDAFYYEMLSDMLGQEVAGEYQLLAAMRQLADMKREYIKVLSALEAVRQKGYGVVTPDREEIMLAEPEVIRHGNKYGVKIKAESPSIHMIKANIESEIAPIVGSEQQAKDLIRYINEESSKQDGIWETNIFGKTIEQLVNDGITSKISMIGDESQLKLQETMQKIVNDSNGGLVCIII